MNLFPRQSHENELKARAHRILDDLKAGFPVLPAQVDWALRITGDLT